MNKRTVMVVALGLVACTSWAVANVFTDSVDQDRVHTSSTPEATSPVLEVLGPPTAGENDAGFAVNAATFTPAAPPSVNGQGGGGDGAPRALCGGSQTISLNIDPVTFNPATGSACPNPNENAFARCFPASLFMAPNPPFILDCLDMGVRSDGIQGAPYNTTIHLSFIVDCDQATVEGLGWPALATPERSITVTLPGDGSLDGQIISVQVVPPLVIDGLSGGLLVEWHKPVGPGDLIPGNNQLGSTCDPVPGQCAYRWAPDCGIPFYRDTVEAGFPADWLFNLGGDALNVPVACCTNSSGLCDDGGLVLAGDCLGADQRFLLLGAPNNFTCADFDPPCGLGACCNNDGTPDGACVLNTLTACAPVGTFPPPPIGANFRWTGGVNCADVSCAPPPLNDDCRFAFTLTGAHVSTAFTTLGATTLLLPSDPLPCGDIFKDAWWTYTVPAIPGGVLVVSTVGSSYDTSFTVYANQTTPQGRCADISFGIIPELDTGSDMTCRSYDVSANNPLSYMIYAPMAGFLGGEVLTIRVGGPSENDGGDGFLNIDFVETIGVDTRCCFIDGTCQDMATFDCEAMGGFWNTETRFYQGNLSGPAAPETQEFIGLGCKTLPCPPIGNACWNPLDLEPMLPGPPVIDIRQEIALTTRQKLHLKWILSPGETITLDACGTAESANGFDTIIEAFGDLDPSGATSNGDCALPITESCGGGVNKICFVPDDPQFCAATTNSCLCVSFEEAVNSGVLPDANGNVTIIFSVGLANPGNDTSVKSIDPVLNPLGPPADVVIGATIRATCIVCQPDCNGNDIVDACDIDCGIPGGPCDVPGCGMSIDCDSNGIPDDCQLVGNDCNADGIPDDACQLAGNDCNTNGTPDECDLITVVTTIFNDIPFSDLDGVTQDAVTGDFIVVDQFANGGTLFRVTAAGVVTPIASGAPFVGPIGVTQDAVTDDFIVADQLANGGTLFRVTAAGVVTPIASGAFFSGPIGVTQDSATGNFIASDPGGALFRVTAGGVVTTIVSGPPFISPYGVTQDLVTGDFIVSDFGANSLFRVTAGGVVTTITSGAPFEDPFDVTQDSATGDFIVSDFGNNTLFRVTAGGVVTTIASDAPFGVSSSVTQDSATGDFIVSDWGNDTLLRVTAAGVVTSIASGPLFVSPSSVTQDSATDDFIVSDWNSATLFRVTAAGVVTSIASGPPFVSPSSVTQDSATGDFIVSDFVGALFRVTAVGEVTSITSGSPFASPRGVTQDSATGDFIVTDDGNDTLFRVTAGGIVTTIHRAHRSQTRAASRRTRPPVTSS